MLNRSHACAALIAYSSVAFAQEATPPSNSGNSSGAPSANSSASPFSSSLGSLAPTEVEARAADTLDAQTFSLPGGLGYTPLNFTPGQGSFNRDPLLWTTSVQQGYDDNIYNSSGKSGLLPKKGSMMTNVSQGADLLLAQSRFGLSMLGNVGGQYYWDRPSDQLNPSGGLSLIFAYKISPRAQLSSLVNAVFTSQPSLSNLYGLTPGSSRGYLSANSKFDFLYQWTPLYSTVTTYSVNSIYHRGQSEALSDYVEQTLGQSFRYALSPLLTAVLEGRASNTSYRQGPYDSNTYYLLVGSDVLISRRLLGSLRVGETSRSYKTGDLKSSSSPYGETSVTYSLTKHSSLGLNARYGYEPGSFGAGGRTGVRTGLSFTQEFSPKLSGNISANYGHGSTKASGSATATTTEDDLSFSIGATYAYARYTTLFANISRVQVSSSSPWNDYGKDIFYLGATFRY